MLAVDFYGGFSFEDEVDFFASFVVVAVGLGAGGEAGFGEALVLDGCVGGVEDAADGGAVCGGEWFLVVELVDGHGGEFLGEGLEGFS